MTEAITAYDKIGGSEVIERFVGKAIRKIPEDARTRETVWPNFESLLKRNPDLTPEQALDKHIIFVSRLIGLILKMPDEARLNDRSLKRLSKQHENAGGGPGQRMSPDNFDDVISLMVEASAEEPPTEEYGGVHDIFVASMGPKLPDIRDAITHGDLPTGHAA